MAVDPRLLRESRTKRRAGAGIAPAMLTPREVALIRKLRTCSKEKQRMVFSEVDQTHKDMILYADLGLEPSAPSDDGSETK